MEADMKILAERLARVEEFQAYLETAGLRANELSRELTNAREE